MGRGIQPQPNSWPHPNLQALFYTLTHNNICSIMKTRFFAFSTRAWRSNGPTNQLTNWPTDSWTNGPKDRRKVKTSYRVACLQLKRKKSFNRKKINLKKEAQSFFSNFILLTYDDIFTLKQAFLVTRYANLSSSHNVRLGCSVTAPAHSHASWVALYPVLFINHLCGIFTHL